MTSSADIDALIERIPGSVMLSGVTGSTAYGMATPDSDVDRLAVYAAPTAIVNGLYPPEGKKATMVFEPPDPDFTVHEARKYALLALKANPTVTELLWLQDYEIATPMGWRLVEIRQSFLSAQAVADAYYGYATSQLRRLNETGQFQSKMRSRAEKHGRHLLRLLTQGLHLYETGRLPIHVSDPGRLFEFGAAVAKDPKVGEQELARFKTLFEQAKTPLPAAPDTAKVEHWLRQVRLAHLTDYAPL